MTVAAADLSESYPRRVGSRGGRPPLHEAGVVPLRVRVPKPLHDAIVRFAEEHGLTISEAVRVLLERGLAAYAADGQAPKRRERPKRDAAPGCLHSPAQVKHGFCFGCGQTVKR